MARHNRLGHPFANQSLRRDEPLPVDAPQSASELSLDNEYEIVDEATTALSDATKSNQTSVRSI